MAKVGSELCLRGRPDVILVGKQNDCTGVRRLQEAEDDSVKLSVRRLPGNPLGLSDAHSTCVRMRGEG